MKNAGAFAALKILHTALLAGQVLFMAVLVYLSYSKTITPALPEQDKIFQLIAIALSGAAFFIGTKIFKKKLLEIRDDNQSDVKVKFDKYRGASIVQWALIEGASLFCCFCFFLVGNFAFLALAAVLIILFGLLAPVKLKAALQMGVSVEELSSL